jgi:hypothetical protein
MPKVVWYFRKKRALGNFSIENSFHELLPHFGEGRIGKLSGVRPVGSVKEFGTAFGLPWRPEGSMPM